MTSRLPDAVHLRDLARLRRVRDRIDREYAKPLNVEALARGVHMSAGHLSRQFKLAFGESPYSYLMTRRIERAMALLRRGDMSVTDVYRQEAANATKGMPACVARQVTRPIRNKEASVAEPELA